MNNNIKISIIVPVYNVQEYLSKCIESIINQTYNNLEIILVDDGSTDNSSLICDNYSDRDNRIKVIHKRNGGLVTARTAGVAIATGDYILNVDGDDWIEEDRIDVLVNEGIKSDEADMIYLSGYVREFTENSQIMNYDVPEKTFYGKEIEQQLFPLFYNIKEAFQVTIRCTMWSWAVKRELMQEKQRLIDDRIIMGEDAICLWFCLLSANSVSVIKHKGYHYVQRRSSLCYSAVNMMDEHTLRIRVLYHQLKKYLVDNNAYTGEIKQIFIFYIIELLMVSNYKLILKKHKDYLFPFPLVKVGSTIVVYGAGKIGYALMKYLIESNNYQVKLWVDKNLQQLALPGYRISPVEYIKRIDYDFIVIAVSIAEIAKEIKQSLINDGIPKAKIATMDSSVITEFAIPDEVLE